MWKLIAITLCAGTLAVSGVQADAKEFNTIGLFIVRGQPKPDDFWKACGYNMIQFVDEGFSAKSDSELDLYYNKLATNVKYAKDQGFRTSLILLSNIPQGRPYGETFEPNDIQAMNERLEHIRKAVRSLKDTDCFTFFAGDPGGIPKDHQGSGVVEWMQMANRVKAVVKEESPTSEFNVNPWAIAFWGSTKVSAFRADFWVEEAKDTKIVLANQGLIGPDCGVEIPPHNYYRSLALKALDAAGISPELYPTKADINILRKRGATRIWAWPHFLIDEGDDGYTRASGEKANPTQSETRYIHKLVNDMRKIGVNGMITCAGPKSFNEALNVYAFGRFCRDPHATAVKVIDEYAGYLTKDSKADLVQVLRFLENHSTWQASIPSKFRLSNLKCKLKSVEEAQIALKRVIPRTTIDFPLPESPADYLKRLRERLEDIAVIEQSNSQN
ncbi:MAG: hypothetical protein ACYC0V_15485 [Armatimonadota bacterium]